jgi:hypothetical protein
MVYDKKSARSWVLPWGFHIDCTFGWWRLFSKWLLALSCNIDTDHTSLPNNQVWRVVVKTSHHLWLVPHLAVACWQGRVTITSVSYRRAPGLPSATAAQACQLHSCWLPGSQSSEAVYASHHISRLRWFCSTLASIRPRSWPCHALALHKAELYLGARSWSSLTLLIFVWCVGHRHQGAGTATSNSYPQLISRNRRRCVSAGVLEMWSFVNTLLAVVDDWLFLRVDFCTLEERNNTIYSLSILQPHYPSRDPQGNPPYGS